MRLKKLPITIVYIISSLCLWNCVPVKKQLIVRDLKRKTLKEIRQTDTTIQYPQFEYKLKRGDVLAINLVSMAKGEYDLTSLSQQGNVSMMGTRGGAQSNMQNAMTGYVVNDSGYVIFPVLGAIKLAGYNLDEAEGKVQEKVNMILDNTTANLRMLNFFVYLMGEAASQGPVYAQNDKLTLLEAIALGGGLTDFADRAHIKIIRNQNNKAHIYYVNLSDQELLAKNNIYLLPNDIVIIEPLRAKVVKTYTIPNITLLMSSLTLILTLTLTLNNILD